MSLAIVGFGCAPSAPAPAPEEETGTATASTADIAPAETTEPVETATPSASASAPQSATATPLSTGGNSGPASCAELAKKKCQVTRGCAWNDVQKCIKEEGAP